MMTSLSSILLPVGLFFITVKFVSIIQWMCVRFLSMFCHTTGLDGLILNVIRLGSPICLAVNNIQYALVNYYITIWAAASGALIAWIVGTQAKKV